MQTRVYVSAIHVFFAFIIRVVVITSRSTQFGRSHTRIAAKSCHTSDIELELSIVLDDYALS